MADTAKISKAMISAALAAVLLGQHPTASAQNSEPPIAVACAASCAYPPLSIEEVESAWSGRRLPDALKGAELVDLPDGSAQQARFSKAALGKDSAQYRAMWAKNVFNGKGRPPKVAADEDQMAALLASNPKAIGYMSLGKAEKSGLKTLLILDRQTP